MIEWLVERYQPHVSGFALIVAPAFVDEARDQVCCLTTLPVEVFPQAQPTGMLDAVLAARRRWRPRGRPQSG